MVKPKKTSNPEGLTHSKLVEIGYAWVMKNASCGVAFKEFHTSNSEHPDVIGFGSWGHSVLLECKVSRSDFLSDKNKPFRKEPDSGMGKYRFYICPTNLIRIEELPDGWGLIYVSDTYKAKKVHQPFKMHTKRNQPPYKHNLLAEHALMYSALRRLELRGRIEEVYDKR